MTITKNELEQLADTRLREAVCLFEMGHYSGAYYLGGYVVELALKAVISKSFRSDAIPDRAIIQRVYTHNLIDLVGVAGLNPSRIEREKSDETFAGNWAIVAQWSEKSRYETKEEDRARLLIEAVRNPDHGVIAWIKTYW